MAMVRTVQLACCKVAGKGKGQQESEPDRQLPVLLLSVPALWPVGKFLGDPPRGLLQLGHLARDHRQMITSDKIGAVRPPEDSSGRLYLLLLSAGSTSSFMAHRHPLLCSHLIAKIKYMVLQRRTIILHMFFKYLRI